jgi:predicted ATPase
MSGDPVMRATQSFLERVEATSITAPMMVCLEDVQWADEASLSLWAQLIDLAQQQRLLLIATSRLMPRSPAVEALRRRLIDVGATVLSLGPLRDADVASLVRPWSAPRPGGNS